MTISTPLTQYARIQRAADQELAKILLDAAREADKIVRDSAGAKGIAAKVERDRMLQASRELRKWSAELWNGPITRSMRSNMTKAAEQAVNSERWFNQVLQREFGAAIPQLEAAYRFEALNSIDNLWARGQNGIPLSESVYKAHAWSDRLVDKEIQRALALQLSHEQLAKRVKALVNPRVPGGISYAAERLARTEINNAFHTSQIARREGEPWTEGMKWHLSGSHPRPDACNDYASRSNFSGGGPGVFKPGTVPGKPHPNCLCYVTTVTISEDEFIDGFLGGRFDRYVDTTILRSPQPISWRGTEFWRAQNA